MSCLTVTLTRVGGVSCSIQRIGGIRSGALRVGGITSTATRTSGLSVLRLIRKSGIYCTVYQVCSAGKRGPYLEISPTIVWILAGHTENNVFSNTQWNII